MQLTIKKTFDWAHRGIEVKTYTEGDVIDCEDEDMAEVAIAEGWAAEDGDDKPKRGRKSKAE